MNDDHFRFKGIEENDVLTSPLTTGGYANPYSTAYATNTLYKGNCMEKVPKQSILRSNLHANNVASEASKKKKETPTIGSIGKEGKIMCRTSFLTLMFRRWKDSYWLHVHPTTILIFQTKESMDEWKMLSMTGGDCSSNGKNLKKLIQWSINFDTSGVVYKRMHKAEKKKCKRMNIPPPKVSTKVNDTYNYVSPIVYAMEEVRSKCYDGPSSPLLHTCKISYLSSSGRTIAAAFGSTKSADLKQFRATVRSCIKLVIKYTIKTCRQKNGENTINSGSTFGGTDVSGAGYSAVASEFSNTVYGRSTMTPSTLNCDDGNDGSTTVYTDSTISSADLNGVVTSYKVP